MSSRKAHMLITIPMAIAVNPVVGPAADFHLAGANRSTAANNFVPPNASCPSTDIDADPRPAGPKCDAGAYEC